MSPSSMCTRHARNVVVFFQLQVSGLLYRVGYVSKLSRFYLGNRPRLYTIPKCNHGGVCSVARTLETEVLARTRLKSYNLSKFEISRSSRLCSSSESSYKFIPIALTPISNNCLLDFWAMIYPLCWM